MFLYLIYELCLQCLRRGCDSWSVSELAHAIVLLAHFHTLSSFVHGCGISVDAEHGGSGSSESSCSTSLDNDHHYASVCYFNHLCRTRLEFEI